MKKTIASFFCSYSGIEKSKLSTIFQVLILQKVHTGTQYRSVVLFKKIKCCVEGRVIAYLKGRDEQNKS